MAAALPVLGLKLGVVGKGGVGKTTVCGLLARRYAEAGQRVVAIDTDSNPNLGLSLGLTLAQTEAVPVLPRRAVVGAGGPGSATAATLIHDYGRATPAGPTLLSAIKVAEAGAGCTCGGHATVRSLLGDALADVDVTLVDMEAGLEHLSRSGGTLAHADLLLVVCEATRKSVLTAARTAALAAELGIPGVLGLGNKTRTAEEIRFLRDSLVGEGIEVAGILPYDDAVATADRLGSVELTAVAPAVAAELDAVLTAIDIALTRLR